MYKKALITDEVSQDLEVALKLAEGFGLQGVEIRSVWERAPHELSNAQALELRRLTRAYGLEVCAIASPFFKCAIDSAEDYEAHLGILRRCIGLAESLEAPLIRGFTFWRKGRLAEQWPRVLEKLEKPVDIIEGSGLLLGVENEASTMIGTGRDLARILEVLGSRHIKAVWDPCNSLWDLEGAEKPYPEGYKVLKPFIAHVHLKDAKKEGDSLKVVALGEGDVGIKDQLKALVDDGYGGYVSLETHYRIAKPLEEDVIDLPKGSRFSAGGYEASRICLANWRNMELELLKD